MNKSHSSVLRRASYLSLFATSAALTGCYTPRPVMIMPAPYGPPVVVQTTPLPQYTPQKQYSPPTQAAPAQSAPQARQLNDAQIAGIMIDLNNAEIREARLALSTSGNPQVRTFGQRMVQDHSRLNAALGHLTARLAIQPVESQTSQNLRATAQQAYSQLAQLRGARFNQTYIQHQVGTHTTALKGINQLLLPNVANPQLRAALEQAKLAIAAHLQHAQQIQARLR